MKVTIYGAGYVGLVTAACLAEIGHDVLCIETNAQKLALLEQGQCPIYEPGLEALLERNQRERRLRFTNNGIEGALFAQVQFIAVGTPSAEDESADLTAVYAVAKTIATHIKESVVIVNKSTVPVGTAKAVKAYVDEILQARAVSFDVQVVSNPEFLKEGVAVDDCLQPDRIIVGVEQVAAEQRLKSLYAPLIQDKPEKWVCMDPASAELTKYASNAMLATRISFMNELSHLAGSTGADIDLVKVGMGMDPRIGRLFLNAGCGYGGSCFPKDVRALLKTGEQHGVDLPLMKATEHANQRQKQALVDKVERVLQGQLQGKTIAVWGLAFKPQTDDIREAPSRVLCEALWQKGAIVQAYDPVAMPNFTQAYPGHTQLKLTQTAAQALEGAVLLVIVTEWDEFKKADLFNIATSLSKPYVIDGRNVWQPQAAAAAGLQYYGIGRGLTV